MYYVIDFISWQKVQTQNETTRKQLVFNRMAKMKQGPR